MKKSILLFAVTLFFYLSASAQYLQVISNTAAGQDSTYEVLRTMSPTNNYHNRVVFEQWKNPNATVGSSVKGQNWKDLQWDTLRYKQFPNTRDDGAITSILHIVNGAGKMGVSPTSRLSLISNQITAALGFTPIATETDPLFNTKFLTKTTTDLVEGINLYWTPTRFSTAFALKSTTDLTEGTNKYYTDVRARLAITLTTTGSGVATYDSATGALNIPTNSIKRQEAYSGTTSGSGTYTITYSAFSVAPNVQANIIGGSNTNLIKLGTPTTTGVTVTVVNRVDVLGLLPTYSNVNGASVDVLITEK